MITHVSTLDYRTADVSKKQIESSEDTYMVSIIDPELPHIFDADTARIARFTFHDVTPEETKFRSATPKKYRYRAMTRKDATRMYEFISAAHAIPSPVTLLAHCTAGICRSGAVVDVARMIAGLDWEEFIRYNRHIFPNVWVRSLLLECWSKATTARIDIRCLRCSTAIAPTKNLCSTCEASYSMVTW